MKTSIAMCTYNGEDYIEEQLKSIAAQTVLPNEMIVCDDGSKDKTVEIIKEFSKKTTFPIHMYVNNVNLGSTKNFEKAIALCNGDIIFCVDQDDIWSPEKMELTIDKFKNSDDLGLVFTDAYIVDEKLNFLGYNLWEAIKFTARKKRKFNQNAFDLLLKQNVVTGTTMAFRKEFKNIVFPFPESWVHDAWIAIIISAIAKVDFIEKPLMKYRQHSKQQIGALKSKVGLNYDAALRDNTGVYIKGYEYFSHVKEKLAELLNAEKNKNVLNKVENKIMHLYSRSQIPERKIGGLPIIINELLTLRYFRYSNGVFSAVKDVLLNFGVISKAGV